MCGTRLAANTGRKKVAKNRHLGTIAQLCRAISFEFRLQVWNVLHAARWKCRPKNGQKLAISAPSHNFVGLYLSKQDTYRQSEKNLLNSSISSTCPYNMVNFGLLTAEIVSLVWGTPSNFNGFRVFVSLLHRRRSMEVNRTLHDVWPSPGLVHCIFCPVRAPGQ